MGFVDIKQTIWVRYSVDESQIAEFKKLTEIERQKKGLQIIDIAYDSDSEWLYDTAHYMSYVENGNAPTIEVQGYDFYWDNTPIEVKRAKTLKKLEQDKDF